MKTIFIILSAIAVISYSQNFSVPDKATAKLLLDLHNIERSAVGVYNLTWSDSLANASQTWANYLAANKKFSHSGTAWVGENIAQASYRSNMTAYMFSLWSGQKKYFDPTQRYGPNSTNNPDKEVGHYTQVIWSMSFEVGCGIGNGTKVAVLVCQYRYAGNYAGNWVYKPSASNPWKAAQPLVNPADLPPPPTPETYPDLLDSETANLLLDLHNIERTFVGMKNLTWSPKLAASAQAHANSQAKAGTFKLSHTSGAGENMQLATIRPDMANYMFGLWSREKKNFDATLRYPKCNIGDTTISHYTQVVWSASKELGCGLATNAKNSILVCQYTLAGNFIGNYVVFPAPKENFNFTDE